MLASRVRIVSDGGFGVRFNDRTNLCQSGCKQVEKLYANAPRWSQSGTYGERDRAARYGEMKGCLQWGKGRVVSLL